MSSVDVIQEGPTKDCTVTIKWTREDGVEVFVRISEDWPMEKVVDKALNMARSIQ